MIKRLGLAMAVAIVATASMAALAPAHVTQVKTNISISYRSNGEGGGAFSGDLETPANRYCEQRRKIELYRDGAKVDSYETERYGSWTMGDRVLQPGTYYAKVLQGQLPAALQPEPGKKHRIVCKGRVSKKLVVTTP
ncbi:MAG TPA: hypothetical protein VK889_03700 [Solirubrobacterales bacterium]|nr:hypothetical protein [Solirubrobacterales bacterium]